MIELPVNSETNEEEEILQTDAETVEPRVLSLAASIAKLRNEQKSITIIDIKKVKSLLDNIDDAATYKKISLLPDIQDRFNEAFNILDEFYYGSKHFESINGILGKTTSDTEVDYFKLMLALPGEK